MHTSFLVQGLASSHADVLTTYLQIPVAGVHESFVHGLWSSQSFAAPRQAPSLHRSFDVQQLLSLQVVPFGFGGKTQLPLAGSQAPQVRHGSLSAPQDTAVPVHTPYRQTSVYVQRFPSLQVLPFGFAVPLH